MSRVLIKQITTLLTIILLLITLYKWYGYFNDTALTQSMNNCQRTAGSHQEYNDCLTFPLQDHQAKQASATLFTFLTIFIPAVVFGTLWLYQFFFLTKRPD